MIQFEETVMGETRQWSAPRDEPREGGNKKALYGAAVILFLLPILYGSGLLSSGYRSKHITYAGISSTETGLSMGSGHVHLREGQTFVVNYDAEIEQGEFVVRVKQTFAHLDAPDEDSVRLVRSGKGRLRIPIRETAFYTVYVYGSPRGGGYDISYTLSWHPE